MQHCPVCASPFTAYARDVFTRRTRREIPLYVCIKCRSAWNPSGYVESDEVLKSDLIWNISVEDRNIASANDLIKAIEETGYKISYICDIGCGTGSLLRAARDLDIGGVGFDVNPHAALHGRRQHNLDIRNTLWNSDVALPHKPDLYTLIMVCEHLVNPRRLISEVCEIASRTNASLFISVPFFNEASWKYLIEADINDKGTIFFDNDVHVTHFSTDGMRYCLEEFGASKVKWLRGGIWYGALVNFNVPLEESVQSR